MVFDFKLMENGETVGGSETPRWQSFFMYRLHLAGRRKVVKKIDGEVWVCNENKCMLVCS